MKCTYNTTDKHLPQRKLTPKQTLIPVLFISMCEKRSENELHILIFPIFFSRSNVLTPIFSSPNSPTHKHTNISLSLSPYKINLIDGDTIFTSLYTVKRNFLAIPYTVKYKI